MRQIAIFDLDGTIDKGDCFKSFLLKVFLKSPEKWKFIFLFFLKLVQFLVLKTISRNNLKFYFTKIILENKDSKFLKKEAKKFVDERLKRNLNHRVYEELLKRKKQNYHLILATGSLSIYAKYFKEKLNFNYLICTKIFIVKNKKIIVKNNCIGKEKLNFVNQYLKKNKYSWKNVVFYSDHEDDMPIFKKAKFIFVIKPNKTLVKKLKNENIEYKII